ncbi:hypothetical protein SK128_022824 [Halocaridina rubra]|uniref:Uncharacterized protein n=1 Tax=Halocaridina rubra TaxID=373956 RepID=A0AAN8XDM6_HALRR
MRVHHNFSRLQNLSLFTESEPAGNASFQGVPLTEAMGSPEMARPEALASQDNITEKASHMMEKMWFKMSRSEGGPSLFMDMALSYPKFFYSRDLVIICFVFGIPLVVFLVLLPSFRKKHWPSIAVVILCYLCGLGIFCSYFSSSWLTGQSTVETSLGPRKPPVKGTVGVMVGLWQANLTLTTSEKSYNYMISWSSRKDMLEIHKSSLKKGWPFPLLSLTAELSGETKAWNGALGDGLVYAGAMASHVLVAAMFTWVVWIVILLEAPELTSYPLILTSILMAFSALAYIGWSAYYIPSKFILGGRYMMLKFGWAWWVIAILSILLTIAGIIILIYDYFYPGKLAAQFRVDFYSQSVHVVQATELLHAYENANESFSSIYPLSLSYLWHGNKCEKDQFLMNKYKEKSVSVRNNETQSVHNKTVADMDTMCEDSNMTLQYINETWMDTPKGSNVNATISTTASSIIFTRANYQVMSSDENKMGLRKRSPTERALDKTSKCDPTLTSSHKFAMIRKGRTMPRHVSVPIIVPQVSPWRNVSGSHKKSLSRIHSKYRPAYSPRKGTLLASTPRGSSLASPISLSRLELIDDKENATYL